LYRPLFTIPVFIATVLLVIHSWLFRGRRNTILFWGGGYIFAFAREFMYQNMIVAYTFSGVSLKLFNVPLTIPMGWLFEAYTSLYLAQFFIGADLTTTTVGNLRISARDYGKRVLPIIALACVITSTVTCAIENVATRMHWWQSEAGGEGINPGWILGHMFTVFWLLTLLMYLTHKPLRLHRNLLYVLLALGFTFVVETGGPTNHGSWGYLVMAAYFAALFMWRQLLVFFLVVIALNVVLLTGFGFLWESVAALAHVQQITVQLAWTMTAMMFYGAYLLWTQRSEHPVRPTHLL